MEVIEWSKFIFSEKYSSKYDMEEAFKIIVKKLGFKEEDHEYLTNFMFMPGGRIIYGLLEDRKNVTLSNCFTIPIKKDSLKAILQALTEASLTMKSGGGVGYNFSTLRPRGTKLLSNNTASSGVISFMRMFDVSCEELINGGNRRGAQIGILDVWHPEIIDFIKCKENGSLRNFNISVGIYDIFMECVKDNEDWHLIFPDYEKDIENYNKEWDGDIYKWIEKGYPVKTYQVIKARELYDLIIKHNYDHAEPGMLFIDTVNKYNPLNYCEKIFATNPCGELPLSYYNACSLGSINWSSFIKNPFTNDAEVDYDSFKEAIEFGVEFIDRSIDSNWFPLKEQYEEIKSKRIIGLGITGLADALAMMKIPYNSKKAEEFCENMIEFQRNTAYRKSIELSKEKGPFPLFNLNEYRKTEYFKNLPSDIKNDISEYGIRNGRLLTIAPTGTTSIIQNNCSSGIEPIFALEFIKKLTIDHKNKLYEDRLVENNAWRIYKKLIDKNADIYNKPDFFVTSSDLKVEDHIRIQSILQKYVDSSISKTIVVKEDYPYEDFKDIYLLAYESKLKGCTVYRPNPIIPPVIIETNKKENKEKIESNYNDNILFERKLFDIERSVRHRAIWKNGIKIYINVSINEEGYPLEVFAKLPNNAGFDDKNISFDNLLFLDRISNTDCICRLVSKLLRIGYSIDEVCKQLEKSSYTMFDFSAILARILRMYPINYDTLESIEKEEMEELKEELNTGTIKKECIEYENCPECGRNSLIRIAGCKECLSCGFSKCG